MYNLSVKCEETVMKTVGVDSGTQNLYPLSYILLKITMFPSWKDCEKIDYMYY